MEDTLSILEKLENVEKVKVENYTKKNGEVCNYTLRFIDYCDLRKKDHEILASVSAHTLKKIAKKFNIELGEVEGIYDVMVSNSYENLYGDKNNQSIAQSSAYTHWGTGSKIHNETGEVYLWGISEKREIVIAGPEKKPVKSRIKTLIKKAINDTCDYNLKGYTMLRFDSIESLNIILF